MCQGRAPLLEGSLYAYDSNWILLSQFELPHKSGVSIELLTRLKIFAWVKKDLLLVSHSRKGIDVCHFVQVSWNDDELFVILKSFPSEVR